MLATGILFIGLAFACPTKQQSDSDSSNSPPLTVGMKWDYPLGINMTASLADPSVPFYSVDLWDTAAEEIQAMRDAGHYISCYFSAGSFEDWRQDVSKFPKSAIGNKMKDWKGEYWLDVRDPQVLQIMIDRIDMASGKNCNGVDPDNVDGWLPDNNAGFPLTSDDAIKYVKDICAAAHERGLGCGLKNSGELAESLVEFTDWDINEECVKNGNECGDLQPFIDAGKPVFHIEYVDDVTKISQDDYTKLCAPKDFSSIIRNIELNDDKTLFCS